MKVLLVILKISFTILIILNSSFSVYGLKGVHINNYNDIQIVTSKLQCKLCLQSVSSTTYKFSDCSETEPLQRFALVETNSLYFYKIQGNFYKNFLTVNAVNEQFDNFFVVQYSEDGDFLISKENEKKCLTANWTSSSISENDLFSSCLFESPSSNQILQFALNGFKQETFLFRGEINASINSNNVQTLDPLYYFDEMYFYIGSSFNNVTFKIRANFYTDYFTVYLPRGTFKIHYLYKKNLTCKYRNTVYGNKQFEFTVDKCIMNAPNEFNIQAPILKSDGVEKEYYYLKYIKNANDVYNGAYDEKNSWDEYENIYYFFIVNVEKTDYIYDYDDNFLTSRINHSNLTATIPIWEIRQGLYFIKFPFCNVSKIDLFIPTCDKTSDDDIISFPFRFCPLDSIQNSSSNDDSLWKYGGNLVNASYYTDWDISQYPDLGYRGVQSYPSNYSHIRKLWMYSYDHAGLGVNLYFGTHNDYNPEVNYNDCYYRSHTNYNCNGRPDGEQNRCRDTNDGYECGVSCLGSGINISCSNNSNDETHVLQKIYFSTSAGNSWSENCEDSCCSSGWTSWACSCPEWDRTRGVSHTVSINYKCCRAKIIGSRLSKFVGSHGSCMSDLDSLFNSDRGRRGFGQGIGIVSYKADFSSGTAYIYTKIAHLR